MWLEEWLYFTFSNSLMSGLIEESWILIAASIGKSLMICCLVEVYELPTLSPEFCFCSSVSIHTEARVNFLEITSCHSLASNLVLHPCHV